MSSVRVLHCADLHIGATESFLGAKSQSRRIENLLTFEKIMKISADCKIDIVLIAGDLLDSNSVEKEFFDRIISAIKGVPDVKVVFSAGNHDPLGFDSPFKNYELPPNLFVLNTDFSYVEFSEIKTRVYGKSFSGIYDGGTEKMPLKADDSFINLMCIHGDLASNSEYNPLTEDFIKSSGMDYVALGHIHKRSEIKTLGTVHYAYCGCAEGQGFDELDSKGVYVGEVSKSETRFKFLPVAKRTHILEKIDVSETCDSQKIYEKTINILKEKYGEKFYDNLYKIILTGSIAEDINISVSEIETRLNAELYFAKVKNQIEPIIDYEKLRQEKTLKGLFVNNMLNRIDEADEERKKKLLYALKLGIKAFKEEVVFCED